MAEINGLLVLKRLKPGDVVIQRLTSSDVALIATDDMTVWRKGNGQQVSGHH